MKHLIPSNSAKSPHPWIESSSFEPASQAEVLQGILDKVKEESRLRIRGGGKKVKVIFDLDSTIFDVKPRSLRILKEFALSARGRELSPEISDWALGLNSFRLLYTMEESARANNIPGGEAQAKAYLKEAFKFWFGRFFTHHYVTADHPSPGAVDYVNRVVDAGGTAVYLTGRDWPGMGRGTVSMLEHFGFPMHPSASQVIMKPNAGLDDAEFKDEALRELRVDSNAVALFDNEPANFHVFEKNFPEAWLVFYHSNCSPKEA
ncbi:MAG TPA: hypothetical protein VIH99_10425, partial [Bdellovibrionota bacterium]